MHTRGPAHYRTGRADRCAPASRDRLAAAGRARWWPPACSRCCWCCRARRDSTSSFPVADLFHVALVVHVDLSVLVWFVAFAGVFWSLAGSRQWLHGGAGGAAAVRARDTRHDRGAVPGQRTPDHGQLYPGARRIIVPRGPARVRSRRRADGAARAVHHAARGAAARWSSGAAPGAARRGGLGGRGAVRVPVVLAGVALRASIRAPTTSCCSGAAATCCSSPGRCSCWWRGCGWPMRSARRLPLCPRVVAAAVRAGAAAGVPDAVRLPCLRRDLGRASPLAHVDDAGRRRTVHPPDRRSRWSSRSSNARSRCARASVACRADHVACCCLRRAASSASPSAAPT